MANLPQISFIGSGNLAFHLAPALDNAGYAVGEVYSQNIKNAEALIERLYQAETKASLDFSTSKSKVFVLCVTDDAIENVAREIVLPEQAILIHTSGSQDLDVLSFAAIPNIGVFYPLQTFTKGKNMDFKEIPIFIESPVPEVSSFLEKMGKSISQKVHKINSHDRLALHVAAVFASNFSNHMVTIAQDVMHQNNLSFEWLKPLIIETISKGIYLGPENAQTGPAKRGDLKILDRHNEFLKEDKELAQLYQNISQHILDTYYQDDLESDT